VTGSKFGPGESQVSVQQKDAILGTGKNSYPAMLCIRVRLYRLLKDSISLISGGAQL